MKNDDAFKPTTSNAVPGRTRGSEATWVTTWEAIACVFCVPYVLLRHKSTRWPDRQK